MADIPSHVVAAIGWNTELAKSGRRKSGTFVAPFVWVVLVVTLIVICS